MKSIVMTAACAALAFAGGAYAQEPARASIVVTGQGRVEAAPDTFNMSAEIVGRGTDQSDAVRQMALAQSTVVDAISSLEGLTSSEITTGLPSVAAVYEGNCGSANRSGCAPTHYVAIMGITMEAMPAERGGDAVSLAAETGARNARLTGLFVANETELRRQATREAVVDARRQAEDIVGASGQRLGRLVHVEEPGRTEFEYIVHGNSTPVLNETGGRTPATQIALTPEPIGVEARLRVTFEIE